MPPATHTTITTTERIINMEQTEQPDRPRTFVEYFKRFGWTKGTWHRDAKNRVVGSNDPCLDKSCLLGAAQYLDRLYPLSSVRYETVLAEVVREKHDTDVVTFNDRRKTKMEDVCVVIRATDRLMAKKRRSFRVGT